jgi:hypothetical protein
MHARTTRTLTVAAVLSAAASALPAQLPENVGALSWGWASPAGSTTEFMDNDSWLSFAFEGEHFLKRTMSIGMYLGWTELYERTSETMQIGSGTITGGQYRHANVFPMLVTARIYTRRSESSSVWPFIGLGAGAYYTRWLHDVGTLRFEDNAWYAGVTPDIGLVIPNITEGASIVLSAKYHYPFVSGQWSYGAEKDLTFWGITLGFMLYN